MKGVLDKLALDQPEQSFPDLLAETIRVFNSREYVRGYSPIQHVMGRAPDEHGRFFTGPREYTEDLCCEGPREETMRSHQLRQYAEHRFLEWNGQQRLSRAANSKGKRQLVFHPGDLVFVWRKQVPLSEAKHKPGGGRFIGPARVLATEKSKSDDGTLKPGSVVWLVRGRRLLKCSVEQLRHASQREQLLEELHEPEVQPWDFPRVAKELGGNDYDDLSGDVPTEAEWMRANDPEQEQQPSKKFRTQSRPPVGQQGSGAASSSRARSRSRGLEESLDQAIEEGFQAGPHWTHEVQQSYFASVESEFWEQPTAMVAIEVEMPDSRNKSEKAIKDLKAYFTGALKRRAVEVSERHLTPEELQQFQAAKEVEVNNFIAARAFESLPEHLRADKAKAVRMRWILTWKHKEDGTRKAKARAVLLGYQDPQYEHRATTSPTTTRQTRQMQLQLSASKGFRTKKGDVTGAFLQSRPYPSELLCIPCKEICKAMNLPEESVTKVRRACYGLVDAPLEWYRSISAFFSQLGLKKLWSDPCCWILVRDGELRGIISGHVDDFLFSGREDDSVWQEVCKAIKHEFKWTDWKRGRLHNVVF